MSFHKLIGSLCFFFFETTIDEGQPSYVVQQGYLWVSLQDILLMPNKVMLENMSRRS
jgi:hypothetical protein